MIKVFTLKNRILRGFLFVIVFYGCHAFSFGQNNKTIDSLNAILNNSKSKIHDTTLVNVLNRLAWEFKYNNVDTSISLSEKALLLAQKNSWRQGEGKSYHQLGVCNYIKGNYPLALEYYLKALTIFEQQLLIEENFNLPITKLKSGTLGNIGLIYYQQKDYPKALEYYLKALEIAEKLGDKNGIAYDLGNIGILYKLQGNYPKALDYYFRTLKISEELGNKNSISMILGNIGILYGAQKDYSQASDYHFKSLKITEELGDKEGIATNLGNIGALYLDMKNYKGAEEYLNKGLAISIEIDALNLIMNTQSGLSELYTQTHQPEKALEHYKK